MSKRSILYVCLAVLGVVVLVLLGYGTNWTGFQAYTDPKSDFHPSKTLWDWMELLIVPLVLGVGVFMLNRSEQKRQEAITARRAEAESKLVQLRAEVEQNQALDCMRENRVQAYLERMAGLLLDQHLRTAPRDSEVRSVARTLTLTALRGLDGERKSVLLRFLRDSKLIRKDDPIVSLSWTDLSQADLTYAMLKCTNLRRANLHKSILVLAYLSETDLTEADLSEADLTRADLRQADLRYANLSNAVLREADLSGAVYDDTTKWPDGFDPIAAGAKKADQPLGDGIID